MDEKTLNKILLLKRGSTSPADTRYNEAIDDVIEMLTGTRPTYPNSRCIDCNNCHVHDENDYFCEARDDLGGEDGQIDMENIKDCTQNCSSFRKKVLPDRNKLGKATCPECHVSTIFYLFNDPWKENLYKNPTVCPSCEAIIFNPKNEMNFTRVAGGSQPL